MHRLARMIRGRAWAMVAALFVVTLAAYGPALRGGFLWDDDAHVTKAALRPVAGLGRIWFEPGATQQYYPVLHSAFWIEHRLWGDAAPAYHLLNVLLHASAACLLAWVVERIWSRDRPRTPSPAAWMAAWVFALHPVAVESVAWISEQKNTLSTVFYLLAALAYLDWRDQRDRKIAYLGATALFVLAVLTKSVTATLPATLLVMVWWREGRLSWRGEVRPLLPWFALGLGAGLFTAWVEWHFLGAGGEGFGLGLIGRCLLAGRIAWFYLGKLLWPANLIFIYPRWTVEPSDYRQYAYVAAALVTLFFLWQQARRGRRGALAGALYFVGSLFPALGFFNVYPFIFSYVADHFQYLAMLGLIALGAKVLLADAGAEPGGDAAPPVRWVAVRPWLVTAMVAGFGLLTFRQCRIYRNAETLYRATLAANPSCWMAEYNLGVTLGQVGRQAEAFACYERALRLRPDFPQAHNNLGVVLADEGRRQDAVTHYESAIAGYRLNPRYALEQADAEANLGRALEGLGQPREASTHYQRALELRPDLGAVAGALAQLLVEGGRASEAIADCEKALRLSPRDPELHNNLAVALSMAGRVDEALAHYREALRLKPDFPDAVFNLATALRKAGRVPEAIEGYREVLRLRPDYDEASGSLAIVLAQAGRTAESVGYYERALAKKPGSAQLHYDLAVALRQLGRPAEAILHYEAALRLKPDYPDAENDLGIALAQIDRLSEAVAHFEAALRLRPDYGDAHSNLGLILRAQGRTREANAHFAEAARLGVRP